MYLDFAARNGVCLSVGSRMPPSTHRGWCGELCARWRLARVNDATAFAGTIYWVRGFHSRDGVMPGQIARGGIK